MHISKIREKINTLLKQYKHNAVPDIQYFKSTSYKPDMEGLGIISFGSMVLGLFIILTENSKKYSFFWEETGNILNLGPVETSVFDNVVCNAVITQDGSVWLLDLIIWDSSNFRQKDEEFRFQCLVRLTTNTSSNNALHIATQVKKMDITKYPSVIEFFQKMTIFLKQ